jgi:hypothetical protein
MNRTWILLTSIGLAAAIPNVTLAVDGVVLISQSSALAGNVTPGDTPGFPVTISVPGSYRLSSNLTVPDANTDAIDITADNVTIDLNGFSILGPIVCSGSPVTCSPNGFGRGIYSTSKRTSVSNGTIQGMGWGVWLHGGFGSLVDNITTISNGFGGIDLLNAIVTRCSAYSNGHEGIFGEGTISNSMAVLNNGDGLIWAGSITGNYSGFNGGNGINATGVLTNNITVSNSAAGITSPQASVIMSNFVFSNGSKITAASGSVVLNNAQQ